MRLNLGIRRRLAPLLDNDRRRIEVANSILLTLIGSPFIYYGDEIGMGDNIWLNDRDGVRTPMQWDAGPNAGFSDCARRVDSTRRSSTTRCTAIDGSMSPRNGRMLAHCGIGCSACCVSASSTRSLAGGRCVS